MNNEVDTIINDQDRVVLYRFCLLINLLWMKWYCDDCGSNYLDFAE